MFSEYEANVKALLTGADETLLKRVPASTNQCRVGFVSDTNSLSPLLLRAVGSVVGELASSGGLAVVAGTLKAAAVLEGLLAEGVNPADATLGYGQCAKTHGEYMASKSGRCCVCTHMFVVVAVGLWAVGLWAVMRLKRYCHKALCLDHHHYHYHYHYHHCQGGGAHHVLSTTGCF